MLTPFTLRAVLQQGVLVLSFACVLLNKVRSRMFWLFISDKNKTPKQPCPQVSSLNSLRSRVKLLRCLFSVLGMRISRAIQFERKKWGRCTRRNNCQVSLVSVPRFQTFHVHKLVATVSLSSTRNFLSLPQFTVLEILPFLCLLFEGGEEPGASCGLSG